MRVALDTVLDAAERIEGCGVFCTPFAVGEVDRDDVTVGLAAVTHVVSSRRQTPLLPPLFSSRRTVTTSMPRSTALHMS